MRKLWHSPTLRSVVIYGASGIGFAGANLILARMLPSAQYGLFTLVIALTNLGHALAPLGLDGMVNRRHVEAGPRLLRHALGASIAVGLAFVLIARLSYGLTLPMLLILFVSTAGGGAMMVAGGQFQSERRYGISLALTQSPNLALLLAAVAAVAFKQGNALLPLAISTLGFVLPALIGWWVLFRERASKPVPGRWFPWTEALSIAGLNAAGLLLVQLDRLIIPQVLPLQDLATFGVLAAVAGSFFRVLQNAVGFTLVPRLRVATSVPERRHLIAHEAKLVGAVVVAGSAAIWFVMPLIELWFLKGKYDLTGALLLAALLTGTAKIMNSFTKSTVSVLAAPSELTAVNVLSWVSVGLAIPAAVFGARWGLVGVIYGVGLGWLLRGIAALVVTLRHLKLPTSVPVTAA